VSVTTSSATAIATTPTTPVSVRLPNSMNGCHVVASWTTGVNEPGSHCGHVEQPRPDPVRRTAPPVTTMPICATRFASRTARVQRRAAGQRGSGPGTPPAGAAAGAAGRAAAVSAGMLLTPPR
jgi:hypothetical protein